MTTPDWWRQPAAETREQRRHSLSIAEHVYATRIHAVSDDTTDADSLCTSHIWMIEVLKSGWLKFSMNVSMFGACVDS